MTSRVLLMAYALVGLANVITELASSTTMVHVTKALLMPLLAIWLVAYWRATMPDGTGRLPRALTWLLVGIGFAWLGDLLLIGDGDLWFVGGILAFMVMQVCYIIAFTRIPGPGLVRAWKISLVPYVVVWLVINWLVGPGAKAMRLPVLVYSVVLVAMAVVALDLVIRVPRDKGWRVAVGAGIFVVSDGLIALTAFGPLSESPALSAIIMATYIVAQGLIVTGFTQAVAGLDATARR